MITFWNTIATRDLERARAFYEGLGWTVRAMPFGGGGITVSPDESALVCVFPIEVFAAMIPGDPSDPKRAQELVQSLSLPSKEDVDALAAKVEPAGGKLIGEPKQQPYGYSCGFIDPDGHVWAALWMPD